MRTSSLVTISLPPEMVAESEKLAKQQHMTRSELLRIALRRYMEESQLEEAVRIADDELRRGTLKVLRPGGLSALMKKSKK
ncbi:MAG TPA: ribbon-helix-helix domain-containing protein [Patescibacteria group bacterium]